MNKYFFYIFPIVAISIIIVASLLADRYNTASQEEVYEDTKTPIDTIEIYKVPSFLKNTTYIYSNPQKYGNKATITDSNYTPPQKYELKRVTVEVKGNIAIVGTDCYITHKILSAEYYKFSNYADKELAILHTSKGEIRIAKVNDGLSEQYPISIKYDNYLVETPSAFIHTKLPKVYKIMN